MQHSRSAPVISTPVEVPRRRRKKRARPSIVQKCENEVQVRALLRLQQRMRRWVRAFVTRRNAETDSDDDEDPVSAEDAPSGFAGGEHCTLEYVEDDDGHGGHNVEVPLAPGVTYIDPACIVAPGPLSKSTSSGGMPQAMRSRRNCSTTTDTFESTWTSGLLPM